MMKIIDEKGRLFGKINAIDFLVILFLLCLSPMFYFGYKLYLTHKPSVADVEEKTKIQSLADTKKIEFTDKYQAEAIYVPKKEDILVPVKEKSETEENQILTRQMSDLTRQMSDLTRQISDIVNRINGLEEKVKVIFSTINQSTSKKKTRK